MKYVVLGEDIWRDVVTPTWTGDAGHGWAQSCPVPLPTPGETAHPGPGEPGAKRKRPQGAMQRGLESGLRTRRLAEGVASILEMKNVDSKVPNLRLALLIPATSCLSSSKAFSFSEPQFPHL